MKLQNIRNILRITALVCAMYGWWGLLYPEFTLTPDTVKVISTEENGEEPAEENQDFDYGMYLDLLNAGGKNIRFRSRLLTELCSFWEVHSWEKSTSN